MTREMRIRRWIMAAALLTLVGGCAVPCPRGGTAAALRHRLDDYVGRECRQTFLRRWGPPKAWQRTADRDSLTWDLPEGSGRALWRLTFDRAGVLETYDVRTFGGVVTYGQCTW